MSVFVHKKRRLRIRSAALLYGRLWYEKAPRFCGAFVGSGYCTTAPVLAEVVIFA